MVLTCEKRMLLRLSQWRSEFLDGLLEKRVMQVLICESQNLVSLSPRFYLRTGTGACPYR